MYLPHLSVTTWHPQTEYSSTLMNIFKVFYMLRINCSDLSDYRYWAGNVTQVTNIMLCNNILIGFGHQDSKTNEMQFLYSIYYELTASTCFEHYLLSIRRRCTNNNWYIAWVLCLLFSTRIGTHSTPTPVAASRHNKHAIHQLLFV
jgi:hypothetical protein